MLAVPKDRRNTAQRKITVVSQALSPDQASARGVQRGGEVNIEA